MINKNLEFAEVYIMQKAIENWIKTNEAIKNILYHYTNHETMQKILIKRGPVFRFTRWDEFKDKNEGKHISNIYKTTCDNLLRNKKISREFYELIIGYQANREYLLDYNMRKTTAYVACFSRNNNSDYMWNNYTKDEDNIKSNLGIDLRSGSAEFLQNIKKEKHVGFEILEIIYSDQEKIELLSDYIRQYYALFKNNCNHDDIKNGLEDILSRYSLGFKEENYQMEEEIRIIINVDSDSINNEEFKYIEFHEDEKYLYYYSDCPDCVIRRTYYHNNPPEAIKKEFETGYGYIYDVFPNKDRQ